MKIAFMSACKVGAPLGGQSLHLVWGAMRELNTKKASQ